MLKELHISIAHEPAYQVKKKALHITVLTESRGVVTEVQDLAVHPTEPHTAGISIQHVQIPLHSYPQQMNTPAQLSL